MNLRYIKGVRTIVGHTISKMELERCEHCQREIPSVNLVMHVAHCQRNVQICKICGEPVSKVNWQEHQEEHEPVKCDLCGKEIPKGRLENHVENSCLRREVACVYCGLEMSFSELNDHEVYCGSRTEPCEMCKKYVMIKDFSTHICDGMRSSGSTSPTIEDLPEETIPCEFCKLQLPVDQLMAHESACSASIEEHDLEIMDENVSTIKRGRKRSNEEEIAEDFPSALDETTDGCHGEEAKQENVVYALPCEVCGELCPSDRLMDHQRKCLYGTENQGASSSRDGPIDNDDDGMWFNNLSLDDGPTTEHFPRLDAFDLMARFHPFFAGSFIDQRFNQGYFS